jgi:hypothetical protein
MLLGRWNPLGDENGAREPWRDPHIRFFNVPSLSHMLQAAGFSEVVVSGHAGAVLRDIPWLGRRFPGRSGNFLYRAAESAWPSLLGYALNAVGSKPAHGELRCRASC